MRRLITLSPIIAAAVILLFLMGGSVEGVLVALALATANAAIVVGITCVLVRAMANLLKGKVDVSDPEKRMLISYAAASPIYLVILLVPIGLLMLAKPYLPEDCSLTIAYLAGLGIAGSILGWLWKKKPSPTPSQIS